MHQQNWLSGLWRLGQIALCVCLLYLGLSGLGLSGLGLGAEAAGLPEAKSEIALPEITVYRDPGCRCCEGWANHLMAQGFQTHVIPTPDMDSLKQKLGVPTDLGSCHTAVVEGYLLEGHVPVAEIQRLIAEQPQVTGIAVPGMPVGTPGMEDGDRRDSFDVISFGPEANQTAVFQHHEF